MPDLTLYHAAPSRSSIVLWMLEEVGEPYAIKLIKLSAGDNMKPDYLAINPMGKVPALDHCGTIITEVAAICTYLADAFPEKKLNIPIGTPRRGVYLKWLFFGPGCMEPAVIDRAAPRKEEARRAMLGYGDFDTTMNVVAKAVEKGPWLMGEQFTAADVGDRQPNPLGHDVQDAARAEGIYRLRGAHWHAAGGTACRGEVQRIECGGVSLKS